MKKRVLLVDDDFAVLAGLAGVLVSEGYNVIHAADGDEAIEKFRHDRSFDLVLLDLNMPKKSGWDVFEQITAIDPFVPVMVITARPDQYSAAIAAGVGALIEKPLDLPFLLQKMEDLMGESAEERLARASGRNPNLSYRPAPKKIEGEVLDQVINPARALRRLSDLAAERTTRHRIVEADFFSPNHQGIEGDSSNLKNQALGKSDDFALRLSNRSKEHLPPSAF
jgi:CheY-like chemotaxis protein